MGKTTEEANSTSDGIPEGRCGYTPETQSLPRHFPVVSCWREVWNGKDRCIWHANSDEKPLEKLHENFRDDTEGIYGAVLRGIEAEEFEEFFELPLVGIDLQEADLTGLDLSNTDMRNADLSGAILNDVTFTEADIQGSDLSNTDMRNANLSGATLDDVTFTDTNLRGSDLSSCTLIDISLESAKLSQSNLTDADFDDANLTDSEFQGSKINDTTFKEARLCDTGFSGVTIRDSRFDDANFTGSSLDNAKIVDSHLNDVDFNDINLYNVDFTDSYLKNTDFIESNLKHADFQNAFLSEADLSDADLTDADFSHATLENATFEDAELIRTILIDVSGKGASFVNANLESANFEEAELPNANFSDAILHDVKLTDAKLRSADLTGAKLRPSSTEQAVFERAIFVRTDLFNADLTKMKFYGATVDNIKVNRGTIFGEHYVEALRNADPEASDDNEASPWDKAAWAHRQREDIARRNALPKQAREAFLRRKDIRRDELWHQSGLRSWLQWGYSKASSVVMRYGESPWQVIKFSASVIVFWAGLYLFTQGIAVGDPPSDVQTVIPLLEWPGSLPNPLSKVGTSLYFSVVTFTTLGYGDIQPVGGVTKFLAGVEALVGAILMALFVAVANQRVSR